MPMPAGGGDGPIVVDDDIAKNAVKRRDGNARLPGGVPEQPATIPPGTPVEGAAPAWPESMAAEAATTIDVRAPLSSGTDVDGFPQRYRTARN